MAVVVEVNQILSLEGKLIIRDKVEIINKVEERIGRLAYTQSLLPSGAIHPMIRIFQLRKVEGTVQEATTITDQLRYCINFLSFTLRTR